MVGVADILLTPRIPPQCRKIRMWGWKATVLSHKCRGHRLVKLSFFLTRSLLEKRATTFLTSDTAPYPCAEERRGRAHSEGRCAPDPRIRGCEGRGIAASTCSHLGWNIPSFLFFFCCFFVGFCFVYFIADVYIYIYIYIYTVALFVLCMFRSF